MILLNFFALKPCPEHRGVLQGRAGDRDWVVDAEKNRVRRQKESGEPMREGQAGSIQGLFGTVSRAHFWSGINPGAAGGQGRCHMESACLRWKAIKRKYQEREEGRQKRWEGESVCAKEHTCVGMSGTGCYLINLDPAIPEVFDLPVL